MKKLICEYMVAYNYAVEDIYNYGVGSCLVQRDKKIKSIEDILELKEEIENQYNINNVAISNFILLGRHWR